MAGPDRLSSAACVRPIRSLRPSISWQPPRTTARWSVAICRSPVSSGKLGDKPWHGIAVQLDFCLYQTSAGRSSWLHLGMKSCAQAPSRIPASLAVSQLGGEGSVGRGGSKMRQKCRLGRADPPTTRVVWTVPKAGDISCRPGSRDLGREPHPSLVPALRWPLKHRRPVINKPRRDEKSVVRGLIGPTGTSASGPLAATAEDDVAAGPRAEDFGWSRAIRSGPGHALPDLDQQLGCRS